ncbi:hypothetical protein EVAR_18678_1 [Eumeta japonica]|uniref:Uncharacterized protein n=1 Tax=Eumeta variegata TaxID=151549 RepID=A0A4C1U7G7_EUMVA|nr:hypothetical protein EVAR_18678_1 [Eumeta japonica]
MYSTVGVPLGIGLLQQYPLGSIPRYPSPVMSSCELQVVFPSRMLSSPIALSISGVPVGDTFAPFFLGMTIMWSRKTFAFTCCSSLARFSYKRRIVILRPCDTGQIRGGRILCPDNGVVAR